MRLAIIGLAAWSAVASAQQALDRQIASAPDGTVRFAYAARPDVCGDGRTFIANDEPGPQRFRVFMFHGEAERGSCLPGPAWIFLGKAGPRITRLEVFVGPELRVTARCGSSPRAAAPPRT